MKFTSTITAIVMILILSSSAEAQIWKAIKNKTKQKIEDKVVEKVSDKLAEVIFGKLTENFNSESNPYRGAFKISKPENLPEEYSFDWKYKVKIKSADASEDDIEFEYRLSETETYFGYTMEESNQMFSVVDPENEAIISYMDEEGESFAVSHGYSGAMNFVNDSTESQSNSDYTVTELPNKTFLGYSAKGYEIENSESVITVYVTDEAGVNFKGLSAIPSLGQYSAFNTNVEETNDTIMLYMKMTSKSDDYETMEMECVDLSKEPYKKVNSTYKFM